MVSIIAAVGDQYEIGRNGALPWRLPEDLKHFKRLTLDKTIVMGRRTFESLPGVLPRRQHVILTGDPSYTYDHSRVRISHDLSAELGQAQRRLEEIFVIGGGQIYSQALPYAQRLYLTLVHASFADADAFFPKIHWKEWEEIERGPLQIDPNCHLTYEFVTFQKRHAIDTSRENEE